MSKEGNQSNMHRRRITLADGRYLIFYTFEGEEETRTPSSVSEDGKRPEPKAEAEAEEERGV